MKTISAMLLSIIVSIGYAKEPAVNVVQESPSSYVYLDGNSVTVRAQVMEELGLKRAQRIDEATFLLILQKHLAMARADLAIRKAQEATRR